jgi:hypothetical protein
VFFGLCTDVDTYPDNYASYLVSVRQYRILPFRFLQCIPHGKPPCDLLILQDVTPAYKGFTPSGIEKNIPVLCFGQINLHFWNFSRALRRVCSSSCWAHTMYIKNKRKSSSIKVYSLFKHSCKQEIYYFGIAYFSYT